MAANFVLQDAGAQYTAPKNSSVTIGIDAPNTTLNAVAYPGSTAVTLDAGGNTATVKVLQGPNHLTVFVNVAVPPEIWNIVEVSGGSQSDPLLTASAGTSVAAITIVGV